MHEAWHDLANVNTLIGTCGYFMNIMVMWCGYACKMMKVIKNENAWFIMNLV